MTWVLLLNDMRTSKSEHLEPVARAETKEALKSYVALHRHEGGWMDTGEHNIPHTTDFAAQAFGAHVENVPDYCWQKAFKRGSPLEWHNPPNDNDEELHFQDAGTLQDRIDASTARVVNWWGQMVLALPVV